MDYFKLETKLATYPEALRPECVPETETRRRFSSLSTWVVFLLLVGGLLTALPGCSGCRKSEEGAKSEEQKQKEAAEKKKKKKKKKPDYEFGKLETIPSDDSLNRNYVKPGHAVTAWVPALANHNDLRAEFDTAVTDISGHPILVRGTNYHLVMARPAVLPKGQTKFLESTFFIPPETDSNTSNLFLQHKLRAARGGGVVHEDAQITRAMPANQYVLAVLSTNPNRYGYLKQLESVQPHFDPLLDEEGELVYYRVVLPSIQQRVPLPSHPFAWTMIAYVLWDGLQPGAMTPGQQQVMVDWLHWGGQLIVSGPGSIDSMAGSFLAPYLPATAEGAVKLTAADFADLNQSWSLVSKKSGTRLDLVVPATAPMMGITLARQPGSEFIPGTGNLVAERRVGRGRVVVTAFPMTHRDIINWPSYDSFFNACMLRRPARRFLKSPLGAIHPEWVDQKGGRRNPRYVTATRYFTRDIGTYPYVPLKSHAAEASDWHWDGCEPQPGSGMGGWNDASGASKIAHQTLKDAAGISIPKSSFVLALLAVYLTVLVPVNWTVFKLLGRVEWAWVAAPVIAIIGAVAVIRLAQLDIGFVRSRTEIAVLEMHGGYPRAHLTRYTALYSSLSSNYRLRFDDTSALARPFPPTDSPNRVWPVTYRRDRDVELSGFQLRSNTTGFLHSEQMFATGGAIQLIGDSPSQWQVQNNSDLDLHDVGVLYRAPDLSVRTCWLGQLPAKTSLPLTLAPAAQPEVPWFAQWETGQGEQQASDDAADLEGLTELAARGAQLRAGDMRLVGWIDGFLPGLTLTPSASQATPRGVVLVHLRRGPLPRPVADENISAEARELSAAEETETTDASGGKKKTRAGVKQGPSIKLTPQ